MPPRRARPPAPLASRPAAPRDYLTRVSLGAPEFTAAELSAADDALSAAVVNAESAVSLALVHVDAPTAIGFFALFGLALRRSCPTSASGVSDELRLSYRKLRVALSAQLGKAVRTVIFPDASERQRLLLRLLLQTDVVPCYGRLLAGATQELRRRPSHRNALVAAEALEESEAWMFALDQASQVVRWTAPPGGPGPAAAGGAAGTGGAAGAGGAAGDGGAACTASKEAFRSAVQAQVEKGQLLEAWAGCFLQLLMYEGGSSAKAAERLSRFVDSVKALGVGGAQRDCPARSFLMLAYVVRVAAFMDGGGLYGMPDDAPEVPVWDRSGALVRGGGGGGSSSGCEGDLTPLIWAASEWTLSGSRWYEGVREEFGLPHSGSSSGLRSPAAVFDVCMRIARAALAPLAAAPQGGPGPRQQGGTVRVGQLWLMRPGLTSLAGCGLRAATTALRCRMPADRPWGAEWGPADATRLRELWRVFVACVNAWLDGLQARPSTSAAPEVKDASEWDAVYSNFPRFTSDTRPAAGVPAGTVAEAMLAAGAIPVCERLIRSGRTPAARHVGGPSNWVELLSYGRLPDLVALIGTAAKMLAGAGTPEALLLCIDDVCRVMFSQPRFAARAAAAAVEQGRPAAAVEQGPAARPAAAAAVDQGPAARPVAVEPGLTRLRWWTRARPAAVVDQGPATRPAAVEPGLTQLAAVWSLALDQLLPGLLDAFRRGFLEPKGEDHARVVTACLPIADVLLPWCDMLLAACLGADARTCGGAAGVRVEGGTHVPPKEDVDAREWRALLQGTDVCGLLATGAWLLHYARGAPCSQLGECFRRTLRLACAAMPQQLCAVVVEAGHRAAPHGVPVMGLAFLRSLLGVGGLHEDSATLADLEALVLQGRHAPEAAAWRLLPPAAAAAVAALTPPVAARAWVSEHCHATQLEPVRIHREAAAPGGLQRLQASVVPH